MSTFLDNFNLKYTITSSLKDAYSWFKKEGLSTNGVIVSILESNGIAGFKFHIPQSEQVKFESDITDNYTALNTAYQDHIALKPIEITVSGLQGEYFYDLHPIENAVSTIVSTVGALMSTFVPEVSNIVKQSKLKKMLQSTQKTSSKQDNSVLSIGVQNQLNALDLWKAFQNIIKLKSAQTRAFLYFEYLWQKRAIFTVETTWKRYDNMVIKSLTPSRDGNADITDFSITFKQLQFAHTKTTTLNALGNRAYQTSPIDVKTLTKGQEVNTLISYSEGISEIA